MAMADFQLPEEGEDLEEIFNEAANVVQANATSKQSANVVPSDAQLLELYGLYKVATTGPCNESQPGIFNMKARSKWNAWKNKSDLSETSAMQEYIKQVINIYNWMPDPDNLNGPKKKQPAGFAPAVSRPSFPVEEENPLDKDTPFGWVKDNEIIKISQWTQSGKADINICDEDSLTLLHWAADRGHTEMCEILLKAGANPGLKDEDDQTALDYAQTCEHDEIINLLQTYMTTLQIPL